MKKIYLIIILLSILTPGLRAISLYPDSSKISQIYFADTSSLYFTFDNSNFLWNNEYFNDVASGYTLIGYHLSPTFTYHFSPHIKAQLGVHLLKYSGLNDFSNVLPRYALTYHKNQMSFTMGALYSGEYHKLHDAVYNYERNFTHYQENGIQFRLDRKRIFLDVWLDWQNYIFRGDDKQEELVAGISTDPVWVSKGSFTMSSPAFFLVTHKGGQINEGSHDMLTAYNYGIGLKVNQQLKNNLLTDIGFDIQYMGFTDNSPSTLSLYKNGSGIMSNVKLWHKQSFFQMGYWQANQFLSLIGNPIYQCYSDKGSEHHKTERALITNQLYYGKTLYRGIDLGIMGETYYDLNDGFFDYSMGIKITIHADFFLTKVKQRR